MRTFFITTLPAIFLVVSPILFLIIIGGGAYYIYQQDIAYKALQEKLAEQTEFTASTTKSLAESIQLIEKNLIQTQNENANLTQNLSNEQSLIALMTQDLQKVTGTVTTLDKLRKIDSELLEKYSKVYFLNEHYVPSSLSEIPSAYLYNESTPQKIHTGVLPHLTQLLQDAQSASMPIYVKSGYRSFYEQANLKSAYSVIYGAGTANKFSADQGYSEHQLGTTVDFITTGTGGSLVGFDSKPAYQWLVENAHKYGFILSYPKNNGYYIYEPWHWRYVGVNLATKLHNDNTTFYNTDQRVINDYLLSFFD